MFKGGVEFQPIIITYPMHHEKHHHEKELCVGQLESSGACADTLREPSNMVVGRGLLSVCVIGGAKPGMISWLSTAVLIDG